MGNQSSCCMVSYFCIIVCKIGSHSGSPCATADSKTGPGTCMVLVFNQVYELISWGQKCPGMFPQQPKSPSTTCFVLKFLWQTFPLATKTNLALVHSTFSSLLPAPVDRHPQNNSEELKGQVSKFFDAQKKKKR